MLSPFGEINYLFSPFTDQRGAHLLTLSEIARHVHGELKGDSSYAVETLAPLDKAGPRHLSFLADSRRQKELASTRAGAVLIASGVLGGPANRIEVDDPYWAFARATELFDDEKRPAPGIHPSAVVHPSFQPPSGLTVGPHCAIGPNVCIGENTILDASVIVEENVSIGKDCRIYPHVVIRRNCKIGDRAILHPGAVIGSDGFGFAEKEGRYTKIRQLGWVEIGHDVEIGANTCIDRGALGPTILRDGVKLDNLIHVAHNVEIGEHSAIAAQTGISGSVRVGSHVKIAGQVGLAGHLEIGDGAFIGAQAGVSKSVPAKAVVTGTPARDLVSVRKIEALLHTLPKWIERIRALESRQPEK